MDKARLIIMLIFVCIGLFIMSFKDLIRRLTGDEVTFFINTPISFSYKRIKKTKKESNFGLNVIGCIFIILGIIVLFS